MQCFQPFEEILTHHCRLEKFVFDFGFAAKLGFQPLDFEPKCQGVGSRWGRIESRTESETQLVGKRARPVIAVDKKVPGVKRKLACAGRSAVLRDVSRHSPYIIIKKGSDLSKFNITIEIDRVLSMYSVIKKLFLNEQGLNELNAPE